MNENYLLTNETGKRLFHTYAKDLPIIDYHCHLQPEEIYENKRFEDLGELWLAHDHYKWRVMRAFGIPERLITGDAPYREKFCALAEIMPKLMGNPVYLWCHLELSRYFGIEEPLSARNAEAVYEKTRRLIVDRNMTPRAVFEISRVEYVCTTDDPADDLRFHAALQKDETLRTRVVPAFRPDKALYCEKPEFAPYLPHISEAAGLPVNSFAALLEALEKRLLFFKQTGSRVNDNGITSLRWADCSVDERESIFQKARNSQPLTENEIQKYRSAFLFETAKLYHKHSFVMQLHIGTLKNANTAMYNRIGPDTGYDCMDDSTPVASLAALLDRLDSAGSLPKTILYPLNINQYESFAVLACAFCNNGVKAQVQLGAPWWFNDQPYGIQKQFESAASLYPIALSAGMLTDSRSFLSYPRHEMYRRILCNYLGGLVERGEYFSLEEDLRDTVEDICYRNAKELFNV